MDEHRKGRGAGAGTLKASRPFPEVFHSFHLQSQGVNNFPLLCLTKTSVGFLNVYSSGDMRDSTRSKKCIYLKQPEDLDIISANLKLGRTPLATLPSQPPRLSPLL